MARDTMEPIAFIRKQLEDAEPDRLRELLHDVVDQIMRAEVDTCSWSRSWSDWASAACTRVRTTRRPAARWSASTGAGGIPNLLITVSATSSAETLALSIFR